jgi:iron complex outermembrane receptor protein
MRRLLLAATAAILVPALALPVKAQQIKGLEEVIVTARKREETLLAVPVVAQAITGDVLHRISTPQDLQSYVPTLKIGDAVQSSGTRVFLRGVGTTSGDPGVDQSISLNVDGLQLTNGLAYKSSLFDLGRIEVLKGPQGLFYGKNSPGGVISVVSADPTDKFELIAGAGYEIEARTTQTDLIVSGPVTDALKLRLAARYSDSDGFFKNPAVALPGTGGLTPTSKRLVGDQSWIVRGTGLWNNGGKLDARLKVNYTFDRNTMVGAQQYSSCPDGTAAPAGRLPYIGGGEDCHFDRTFYLVALDPAAFPAAPALGVSPLRNGGVPTREATQWFGSFELNYHLTPSLTVTSLTAYYHLLTDGYIATSNSTYAGSQAVSQQSFRRHDLTEELRVNSDFTGPINFTAGAFYQDGQLYNLSTQRGNILQFTAPGVPIPAIRGLGVHTVDVTTYSVFGQLRWKVFEQLELTGGARWSNETRHDYPFNLITGTPVPVAIAVPRIHSDNIKPEFTATYRPSDTLSFFASYKTGYKSGSLNIATGATPGQNNSYDNEYVKGGEIGMKGRFLDRSLAINLAGYDYHYSGLQVTVLVPAANLLPIARTLNAGSARSYGAELDTSYRPPTMEDLTLHGSVNWIHARFNSLQNVPCYGGQMISEGCNQAFNPSTGLYTAQNLDGTPLIDAPSWSGTFGFTYERPIGGDISIVVDSNTLFSSKYITTLGRRADLYQPSFAKTDLSLAIKGPNDRWKVALVGKNLNNEITRSTCATSNAAGGLLTGGQVTGGTTRGPAGIDEVICYPDSGREVWLTLTVRPFN